jgi:hypothetical protein
MLFLFAAIWLLTLSSEARSQILWHVTHTDADKNYSYHFTSISCKGNNCTAGALLEDIEKKKFSIVFYRSADGGQTWTLQDPGLPYELGQNQNEISVIQQIDSLNVIGIGDSGLVVRTFDGGRTWEKQDCHTLHLLSDVSFSDSLNGIIVGGGEVYQVRITSDGGRHWTEAPFQGIGFNQCYCLGPGKFRFLKYAFGPLYTTFDDFKTIDSTKPIFDSINDPGFKYIVTNMNFTGGDTIVGYGSYYDTTITPAIGAMLIQTTDAGQHWTLPYVPPRKSVITYVSCMTPLYRDTVFAIGKATFSFLFSIDHGFTWQIDTVIIDTAFVPYVPAGISITGDGTPVAIFRETPLKGAQSILVRGNRITSHVESYERIVYNTHLYPNPAAGEINIISIDNLCPVYFYDMLGRKALSGITSDQGRLQLDISHLPQGIYSVILDHFGKMLPVGKLIVLGK